MSEAYCRRCGSVAERGGRSVVMRLFLDQLFLDMFLQRCSTLDRCHVVRPTGAVSRDPTGLRRLVQAVRAGPLHSTGQFTVEARVQAARQGDRDRE